MSLHWIKKGTGPVRVWMHGLLGNGLNLLKVATPLSGTHYFLDAKNHGKSPHSAVFTYDSMADDLVAFLDSINQAEATVIGHSLGGKAIMTAACKYPSRFKKIAILDVAPINYFKFNSDFTKTTMHILTTMQTTQLAGRTREQILADLLGELKDNKLVEWLGTNLASGGDGLVWRVGISNLQANFPNIAGFPDLDAEFKGPILAVVGEASEHTSKSKALKPGMSVADLFKPLFPQVQVRVIGETGHMLHTEKPAAVTAVLQDFLEH
jgi:esterase